MTSTTSRPPPTLGMHHIALLASNYEATRAFYVDLIGMQIEWEPDADNVYLTLGSDNVALHRSNTHAAQDGQRLDHFGFIVSAPNDVDLWHKYLVAHHVPIVEEPRTHRDGARSLYCLDPEGTKLQIIFHPPLV